MAASEPYDVAPTPFSPSQHDEVTLMKRFVLSMIALALIVPLIACGGGGGNNNPPSITVTPATVNVQEGATAAFTANVMNSSNTAVTWQVNGVTGGNTTVGTIDSTGLYTAPAAIPNPATVTITAVLQADSTVTGNAIATITAVQFSNASLKGNYVFTLSGIDVNGFTFYAAGVVTADGNGNITGGEGDWNDASTGYFESTGITGTYSVDGDGRGTLNITAPGVGTFGYAFAIRVGGNAGMNEIDNNVINATGLLEAQAAGATAPSGTFAFGYNGIDGLSNAFQSIGLFNLQNPTVGGVQDLNFNGAITTNQTLTGSFSAIDGLGRGTGTFAASTGSSDMVYYVVSNQRFRFVCPDANAFFLGSADQQNLTTPFSGPYVISTSANTQSGISYTLMQINVSNGNISSGFYDVNDTGTVGQSSLTGAYTADPNGHLVGSFTVSGSTLPFSMFLVSGAQAYYLDQRNNAVGGGNVYAQSVAVTNNAAWSGSFALRQNGYFVSPIITPGNSTTISGQLSADGNGNLTGTLDFNDPANVFPSQSASGTYAVGQTAPGRTTVAITTPLGTRNYLAYIVNDQRVQMIEVDNNLVSSGENIRQF